MKQIYFKITFLLLLSAAFAFQAKSQVVANNDNAQTGPSQKVRVNVIRNDSFSCNHYTLKVISVSPPTAGTAKFKNDVLIFTPAWDIANQTVSVRYKLECADGSSDQATVTVFVREYNLPINVVNPEAVCIEDMDEGVEFSPTLKYKGGEVNNKDNKYLDGFSMPIVGDLNGDGKPEVIAMGMSNGADLSGTGDCIIVFDGQTGAELYRYSLSSLDGSYRLRYEPRHNSPGKLAMADVDADGITEIVVVETGSTGKVFCIKPTYDVTQKKLTGFTKLWEGSNYKAPISGASFSSFGAPVPYIVDLNGDGIPEVIVYNKIYNAQTGALVCALETLNDFTYTTSSTTNATIRNSYAYVGRRPGSAWKDDHIPRFMVADIDGDEILDIIAGSKVYLMKNGTGTGTVALKDIIHGPSSITAQRGTNSSNTVTTEVNDGFTAVADIDGDGMLDVIVLAPALASMGINTANLLYVWTPMNSSPSTPKAATYLYSDSHTGTMSYPFIGDINGHADDYSAAKQLPEICFNGGVFATKDTKSSLIAFHPSSNAELTANISSFNKSSSTTVRGHVVGFTYHANPDGSTPLHERLKLSWAMEHGDESSCTGITMFDFDNDGIMELCYRDEAELRVISPARSTFIKRTESASQNGPIRFKATARSYTGFEAPVIADVNMDGSADIVTLSRNTGEGAGTASGAYLYVYEHKGGTDKWAPCPPVWNQTFYNPLHINEDMTVPIKPQSMLTTYTNRNNETIQPFNGVWIQQPIVKEGEKYLPVYRLSDAVLISMNIEEDGSNTKVSITIRNDGLASISANTPVHFYMTTTPGSTNKLNEQVKEVGIDIFSGEKVTLEYTIAGNLAGKFLHCRLVDDGVNFPATGYTDCNITNNYGYTVAIKAEDDRYASYAGKENIFDILVNDVTIGNPILEVVDGPSYGIASITSEGKLSYTPNGILDKDTLHYTLKCEYDGTVLATIDTAHVFFTIKTLPVPTITGAEVACNNDITTYTTEAGMSVYSWAVTSGTIIDGDGTNTIKVQWVGSTGSVNLSVTNNKGESSATPAIKNVTIKTLPVPTITGPGGVCLNSIETYTTEAGMASYSWGITGGIITEGDGTNVVKIMWTGTSGNTSLNVTNNDGCTSVTPATKSITINPLPVPTITGPSTACPNTIETYTTEIGMVSYSWVVSGGTISEGDGTNTIKVQWAVGIGSISLDVANTNGCSSVTPTTKSVTVNPLPVPTITGPNTVCLNAIEAYTTEAGMSAYSWSITGGTITEGDGTNSIKVQWTGMAGNINLEVTNNKGCTSVTSATKSITINQPPVPTITGSSTVCLNAIEAYTTEAGMSTYSWNVTDGAITEGDGTNTVKVKWIGNSGLVSLGVTDTNGCSSIIPTTKSVTVNPLPAPTITGPSAVCLNAIEVYTAEAGMSTYNWSVTGGTITEGYGTNVVKVQWMGTSGNISLNVTNNNGCTSATPAIKSITVNPLPVPTITGPSTVCLNATEIYTTEAGMSTYSWGITGGTITEGYGTNIVKVKWTGASGNISLNVTNNDGCTSATPATKSITINQLPVPTITGPSAVCLNTIETYTTEADMASYSWNVTGGTITEGDGTNVVKVKWTGTSGNISLNVTNSDGCTSAIPSTKDIVMNPLLLPTIAGKDVVCYSEIASYTTEDGMSTYNWTVTGGTIIEGNSTNSVKIQWMGNNGSISLNVTNNNGCSPAVPVSKNITINALFAPTITGDVSVWSNSTTTYTTESGMSNYSWVVTGGTIQSGQNSNSITVNWGNSSSGSIKVSYDNSSGCRGTSNDFNILIQASGLSINATSTNIIEGGATEIISVCLAPNTYAPIGGILVTLAKVSTSTTSEEDYTLSGSTSSNKLPATILIQEGERCASFNIKANSDDWIEGPETLIIKASTANFPDSEIELTIIDRTIGDIVIKSLDSEIAEESTNIVKFWVGFKENVKCTKQVKVSFQPSGTAQEGLDYETLPKFVVIPIGERGTEVEVKPKSNFVVQGDRTLELVLTKAELL